MKIEQKISNVESRIAEGVILSKNFARKISEVYESEYVTSPIAGKVINWAIDYYKSYKVNIGDRITDVYLNNENKLSEEEYGLIGNFLERLDSKSNPEEFNEAYHLNQAEKYFKRKALIKTIKEANIYVDNGEVDQAEEIINSYRSTSITEQTGFDPIRDKAKIISAFNYEAEILFKYPGVVGDFLNRHLIRDGFISFLGPEKRGKTQWLIDAAVRAYKARNNVLFISIGDMTERQVIRRIASRICKRSHDPKFCSGVEMPMKDCMHNQRDTCTRSDRTNNIPIGHSNKIEGDYSPCTACENIEPCVVRKKTPDTSPLSDEDALRRYKSFASRTKGKQWKCVVIPSRSWNVTTISNKLEKWEEFEDFVPDVIVIDYADNLSSEAGKTEKRHEIKETWSALRALSTEKHCLVITATQADTAAYTARTMNQTNFSESKTKGAEVTAMLGLNQTEQEKRDGLMRLNFIFVREDSFTTQQTVSTLTCPSKGIVIADSFWTPLEENDEDMDT